MTWRDIEGWFDFEDVYDLALDRANGDDTFVEIGSWKGKSAAYMGDAIKRSGKEIAFMTIDTFLGSPAEKSLIEEVTRLQEAGRPLYEVCCANLEACGVKEFVQVVINDSVQAARDVENGSVDFCFIDGGHDFDSVFADLQAWFPKMKIGGLIAGHDIRLPGVKLAVKSFFGMDFKETANAWPSWIHHVR